MAKKKKKTKPKSDNSILSQIVDDIRRVATEAGCEPAEIKMASYRKGGGQFTEWQLRSNGGLTNIIRDAFGDPEEPDHMVVRGTQRRRAEVRRLRRELGDTRYSREWLTDAIRRVSREMAPLKVPRARASLRARDAAACDRENVGHFSDIHFGVIIDPYEVEGNQYNLQIAARRFACVVDAIARYKLDHRKECLGLVLNFAGDILQGLIHTSDHNQEMLVHQAIAARRYITQAIAYLLQFYDRIRVPMSPGNHDRLITFTKGRDRATAQKYDNLLTIVFEGVQAAFWQDPRVTFEVPKTPYTSYRVFDRVWTTTHYDTFLTVGNPERSVDVAAIGAKVDKINAGLSDADRIQVVLGGHVHTALYVGLMNDVDLFINPSLSGSDPHAAASGYMRSRRGQWLIESTRDWRVGDTRMVWADGADLVSDYDEIITPYDYELVVKKALV